jgi:hypothetical protein
MIDLTELELAHARAVNSLLGNIPKLRREEACEIVESIVTLMLITIKDQLLEDQNAINYN